MRRRAVAFFALLAMALFPQLSAQAAGEITVTGSLDGDSLYYGAPPEEEAPPIEILWDEEWEFFEEEEEPFAEAEEAEISAQIQWGDMHFTLYRQDGGEARYCWSCEAGSNAVTVTNTSQGASVQASYSYSAEPGAFAAPLYAFPTAEDAAAAGRGMAPGAAARNLTLGISGAALAPGRTESVYAMFADASGAEVLTEDYSHVGTLHITVREAADAGAGGAWSSPASNKASVRGGRS